MGISFKGKRETWGFPSNGVITNEKGAYGKTKQNNADSAVCEHIAKEEWGTVFSELTEGIPLSRLSLLWDIFIETDLTNLEQLEDKIYLYGKSLGSKDYYGRIMFTRMVQALRKVQNATG